MRRGCQWRWKKVGSHERNDGVVDDDEDDVDDGNHDVMLVTLS